MPSWPQYCRVTPTECRPFLGKPVSSMIQAATGPPRSIAGSTSSATPAFARAGSCPASRRPTTAHYQQNEARIDAWQRPVPVPSRPPSVRRSYGQSASTAPGSNHASAAVDRHDPAQPRAPRHRPQIALHSPHSTRRPSRSPDPNEDGPEFNILLLSSI